jgi:hypothetical protein
MRKDVQPVPQAQVTKQLARVAQPLPRHYNGQGVARPSDFVPISDGAFMPAFEALWAHHIEFGTNRSHKKLFGKRRDDRPSAAAQESADASARRKKPRRAAEAGEAALDTDNPSPPQTEPVGAQGATGAAEWSHKPKQASVRPNESSTATTHAAPAQTLPNKGRFSSTLAARLLG